MEFKKVEKKLDDSPVYDPAYYVDGLSCVQPIEENDNFVPGRIKTITEKIDKLELEIRNLVYYQPINKSNLIRIAVKTTLVNCLIEQIDNQSQSYSLMKKRYLKVKDLIIV